MLRIQDHQSLLHLMITLVHWNHNIRAQLPVQRSDVHHLNASTSEYAQKHQLMCIPAHPALHHLTQDTSLVTDVDQNKVQHSDVHKPDVQNVGASTNG